MPVSGVRGTSMFTRLFCPSWEDETSFTQGAKCVCFVINTKIFVQVATTLAPVKSLRS